MRKSTWITGGVLLVAGAMLFAGLKPPPPDDFESLKPYVTEDKTGYFSASEVTKNWATLAAGTSMTPPNHDTSSRSIKLNGVPAKDLLEVVEGLARARHLSRGKPFPGMHVIYSPNGILNSEQALSVTAPTEVPYTLETLAKVASRNEKLKEVWIFDMRPLSVLDEMRIRVRNKGRMPYINSIQQ